MMQAESDGERQAEMRDAVSTLLHPVGSWSACWLTTSDVLTKHYHCNYNTSYIYTISCGHLEGLYFLFGENLKEIVNLLHRKHSQ